MQFHLNGFQSGDPRIVATPTASDTLPEQVDVLIVGSGPAGLTLAAQLSAFRDISTRIVEQKDGPLNLGQADGIACRTMEMFEAFGFCERVIQESYWVNEVTFWKPDAAHPENITRQGRIQDVEDGLSEMPHVILNQARVHDFYLDLMRGAPAPIVPDYARQLLDLSIDAAADYPVTARLKRIDAAHKGEVETVRARYVVGCDGARSQVRRSLGRELRGDSANQAWGVMDVLAVTDFPDVRLKATIHSAQEGSILIIPREGGYLVRFYVELEKLNADERVAGRNITIDRLISAAQRILHPYTLDVKEVAWWSVYEIGQRLCDRFDDVPDDALADRLPHVFIAGDACHTHSPKAGQGMNVSMQDSFNLGWKLAAVLRGQARPELLHSYTAERQAIAQELIDFDGKFARMFSAKPKSADGQGSAETVDPAEFQRYFQQQGRFTAGTATRYTPSLIQGPDTHQALATGLPIGMRFHSAPVIRLADAKPVHLGHAARADGRWRLYAFADAGDPAALDGRLQQLCRWLAEGAASPIRRFTPADADIDSIFDLRAVLQQDHRTVSVSAMPALLLPQKGRYGLRDYEKIFCPDLKNGPDIFDLRGIDRTQGALVVVRPDQYIAHILPLHVREELTAFFDGFMLARG